MRVLWGYHDMSARDKSGEHICIFEPEKEYIGSLLNQQVMVFLWDLTICFYRNIMGDIGNKSSAMVCRTKLWPFNGKHDDINHDL